MNNFQYIVKDDTRAAMHMAVELCERGDFDSVTEAVRWLMRERDKSRWAELFGTPERAAQTIWQMQMATDLMGCCDSDTCPAAFEGCWKQTSCPMDDYDVLLEWLRGDA